MRKPVWCPTLELWISLFICFLAFSAKSSLLSFQRRSNRHFACAVWDVTFVERILTPMEFYSSILNLDIQFSILLSDGGIFWGGILKFVWFSSCQIMISPKYAFDKYSILVYNPLIQWRHIFDQEICENSELEIGYL